MEEELATNRKKKRKKQSTAKVILTWVLRVVIVVVITIVILLGTIGIMLHKMVSNESTKPLLITTLMESGQLKFVAHMVASDEEIQQVVEANAMKKMEVEQNTSLIQVATSETPSEDGNTEVFDENGIRLEEISGRSFFAKIGNLCFQEFNGFFVVLFRMVLTVNLHAGKFPLFAYQGILRILFGSLFIRGNRHGKEAGDFIHFTH